MSWPTLNPGDLRHWVTLQQYTVSSPLTFDVGGAMLSWSDFARVKAKLVPMRGTDVIKAGQDISKVPIAVTIRYLAGVLAKMRIVAPNGTYVIQAIENVEERNTVLVLTCLALGINE